jgi:hypothetical protein
MNSSIKPIDVRNSWHWNFLQFAGRAKYLQPRNRQLDNPVTSCNYIRAVLFALTKVVLCLVGALFLSYSATFALVLNVIYQWNITGGFHAVMEIMLLDLSEPYRTIVSTMTAALFTGSVLGTVLGVVFVIVATHKFISERNRARRYAKWAAEGTPGVPNEPEYKNSSTYKLYKSFVDKFCVPIRTE